MTASENTDGRGGGGMEIQRQNEDETEEIYHTSRRIGVTETNERTKPMFHCGVDGTFQR